MATFSLPPCVDVIKPMRYCNWRRVTSWSREHDYHRNTVAWIRCPGSRIMLRFLSP